MRLNQYEIDSICTLALAHFGKGVRIFLFGSRTIDSFRGGDIDLFISNPDKRKLTVRSKIAFLSDLILRIGEQKIDVVLDNAASTNSKFFQTIKQTSIQLC